MLYIAIAMILVGVLCFVYVSIAPTEPKPSEAHQPVVGGHKKGKLSESDMKETLYHARNGRDHREQEEEERIRREREFSVPMREFSDSTHPSVQNSQDLDNYTQSSANYNESMENDSIYRNHPDREVVYTKPKIHEEKPEIVESVTILGSNGEKIEPAPEERLIVKGLVFLDSKGKLPLDKKEFSGLELSESAFQELRRIGSGSLLEEAGKLIFRVKNISYTYEPRDLKQIVFYDEAVVFLPIRNDLSSVIFFTEDTEAIKAFFAQAEQAA